MIKTHCNDNQTRNKYQDRFLRITQLRFSGRITILPNHPLPPLVNDCF
jgi:hypothetical protein